MVSKKIILKSNEAFSVAKLVISTAIGAVDGLLSSFKIDKIYKVAITFIASCMNFYDKNSSSLEIVVCGLIITLVSLVFDSPTNISIKKICKYDNQLTNAVIKSWKKDSYKILRSALKTYFKKINGIISKYISSSFFVQLFYLETSFSSKTIKDVCAYICALKQIKSKVKKL